MQRVLPLIQSRRERSSILITARQRLLLGTTVLCRTRPGAATGDWQLASGALDHQNRA